MTNENIKVNISQCPFCGGTFEVVKTTHQTYVVSHNPKKLCPIPGAKEYFSLAEIMETFRNFIVEVGSGKN